MKETKSELAFMVMAWGVLVISATLALMFDKISAEQWLNVTAGASTGMPVAYGMLRTWLKGKVSYAKLNGTNIPDSSPDTGPADTEDSKD